MKNFEDDDIIYNCKAGTNIGNCLVEAAQICLEKDRVFRFRHNGKVYTANPGLILRTITDTCTKEAINLP